jgi:hypothetical protein
MIRTKLPARCIDCNVRLNSENRASSLGYGCGNDFADTCMTCYDAAGLINEHEDSGHEEPVENCPSCNNAPKMHVEDSSKAHAPQTHSSHAECAHESTKAARAKCRRQRNV